MHPKINYVFKKKKVRERQQKKSKIVKDFLTLLLFIKIRRNRTKTIVLKNLIKTLKVIRYFDRFITKIIKKLKYKSKNKAFELILLIPYYEELQISNK